MYELLHLFISLYTKFFLWSHLNHKYAKLFKWLRMGHLPYIVLILRPGHWLSFEVMKVGLREGREKPWDGLRIQTQQVIDTIVNSILQTPVLCVKAYSAQSSWLETCGDWKGQNSVTTKQLGYNCFPDLIYLHHQWPNVC